MIIHLNFICYSYLRFVLLGRKKDKSAQECGGREVVPPWGGCGDGGGGQERCQQGWLGRWRPHSRNA